MKEIVRTDRREIVENVVEKILQQKKYGDIISHEELEEWIGYERDEAMFLGIVAVSRELLIEYGYVLRNVLNEGYKVLFPNEIAEEVIQKHFKQSTNKLSKAIRIMQYTDRDMLKKDELKFFESVENLISKTYTNNENALFEAQALLNDAKMQELAE